MQRTLLGRGLGERQVRLRDASGEGRSRIRGGCASTWCWCGISTNRVAAYLRVTVGTENDTKCSSDNN
jgi:hypothetical protein